MYFVVEPFRKFAAVSIWCCHYIREGLSLQIIISSNMIIFLCNFGLKSAGLLKTERNEFSSIIHV